MERSPDASSTVPTGTLVLMVEPALRDSKQDLVSGRGREVRGSGTGEVHRCPSEARTPVAPLPFIVTVPPVMLTVVCPAGNDACRAL